MALDEFELIRRHFAVVELSFPVPGLVLGIGDDCALLELPPGEQLAMSMDCLQEDVHFPAGCDPRRLAEKALRVNLSDLAAMGAAPLCFTLGLSLPQADTGWLAAFAQGLGDVARQFRCPLAGGDTTRGSLSICIQVQGTLPRGKALQRSGARVGDIIHVTGRLGDSAMALPLVLGGDAALSDLPEADREAVLRAYYHPEPRVAAGQELRDLASAAIDLSDGLASDLGHILQASGVGAEIDVERLPLSDLSIPADTERNRLQAAISGGDDYELCFTAAPENSEEIQRRMQELGLLVTAIGRIRESAGIEWRGVAPDIIESGVTGYRHFH